VVDLLTQLYDESDVPILTFTLGEQICAIKIVDVVEVAAMVELTKVAGSRPELLGVANRHGEVLPVLDLRLIMGVENAPVDVSTLFIVTRHGDRLVGFVVDTVQQVDYVPSHLMKKSSASGEYIRGIISYKQQLIQMVNLQQVIADHLPDALLDTQG